PRTQRRLARGQPKRGTGPRWAPTGWPRAASGVSMHVIKPSRRVAGLASLSCTILVAALTFASLPAGAQSTAPAMSNVTCPVLSVGNPNPGDDLTTGGHLLSGIAFDPAATQGSGIQRVDLFLGERENGGTILGSAVPGASGDNPRAWSVEVQVPDQNRGV